MLHPGAPKSLLLCEMSIVSRCPKHVGHETKGHEVGAVATGDQVDHQAGRRCAAGPAGRQALAAVAIEVAQYGGNRWFSGDPKDSSEVLGDVTTEPGRVPDVPRSVDVEDTAEGPVRPATGRRECDQVVKHPPFVSNQGRVEHSGTEQREDR
jgi:hypothetical protein